MRAVRKAHERVIRVVTWPPWYGPNRYVDLLYEALRPYGIEHLRGVPLACRVLTRASAAVDVLHLHWPEVFWRDRSTAPGRVWALARLRRILHVLAEHAIHVVWTVHNLEPHEGLRPTDWLGYQLLHTRADLRVFHSLWAREVAAATYPRARGATLVIPHGNYDGAVPPPLSRAATLAGARIDDSCTVLLCVGQVRAYKGFDVALAALDQISHRSVHLVVAGRPVDSSADRVRALAEGRSNVTTILRDLTDQELSDWMSASDVVLLPYRRLTGSGVLLHALTCHRGIVASDLPAFQEVLAMDPEAGVLVPAGNAGALAAGIDAFLSHPREKRCRAARGIADRLAWSRIVEPLARWMRDPTSKVENFSGVI